MVLFSSNLRSLYTQALLPAPSCSDLVAFGVRNFRFSRIRRSSHQFAHTLRICSLTASVIDFGPFFACNRILLFFPRCSRDQRAERTTFDLPYIPFSLHTGTTCLLMADNREVYHANFLLRSSVYFVRIDAPLFD